MGKSTSLSARVLGVVLGVGLSGTAVAQSAPGWYMGIEGFASDVDTAKGDFKVKIPTTGTVQANGCILPIDLLGSPVDISQLGLGIGCVLGDNSVNTLTPGSTITQPAKLKFSSSGGGGATFGYLFDGGLRPEINLRYAENDVKSIAVGGGDPDKPDNTKVQALRLMGNVWYDVDLGVFAPYFGVGAGLQQTKLSADGSSDDDLTGAFQLGAGLGYWFGNQTKVSLDYRYVSAQDPKFSSTDDNGVKTTLKSEYKASNIGASFIYSFGGEFKDSDGDGVLDRKDKCPNTPQGVQVYSDGCPIDLDQDGVPDYLDKCPNTPPGTPVDANGCPFDSDGDGVPDHLDQCPGTPANTKVDGKGCPLDSDGDGVPDYLDKCPDSKPGTPVDASGCAILDSDGDGIPDNLDKCPNSDPKIKVGPDGCPLDSDGDGIPDYLDECPKTPAGLKVLPNGCALVGDCRTPRAGEPVDANGCALDQRFILRGVKFEYDSDKLTKAAELILNDVADTLAAYPEVKVEVQGHTDSLGTDAYNLGLSERRANSVKRYLVGRGAKGDRLRPVGYGESAPIADNGTPAGQEENRRVEFRVLD